MKVWRIHLRNDIDEKQYSRDDLWDFCQKEFLIGVGWSNIKTRGSDADIRREAHGDNAAYRMVKAMSQMEIEDLIWTYWDGNYYLCKVVDLWKNSNPQKKHDDLDISNYVNVEWLHIGREDLIPGKVVRSFRPNSSVQRICDVENISMYLWNEYSRNQDYKINKNFDMWTLLPAENIEELFLLYLQVEEGYFVYTSTAKHSTRTYECVMINSEGIMAFPQVKSGNESLDANDYIAALQTDKNAQIYLFAVSEKYKKSNCSNVHYINKATLEGFIRRKKNLLPNITRKWIELSNFK